MATPTVTIGNSGPSLVVPQLSSAPTAIGAPQYVANAQERMGKQGGTFIRPGYPSPQFATNNPQSYNQIFQPGQQQTGVPPNVVDPHGGFLANQQQPTNKFPPITGNPGNGTSGGYMTPAGGGNTIQGPPSGPQYYPPTNTPLPASTPAASAPIVPSGGQPMILPTFGQPSVSPQPPAQPAASPSAPGNYMPGYSIASYDRGNGRMPYRTYAR